MVEQPLGNPCRDASHYLATSTCICVYLIYISQTEVIISKYSHMKKSDTWVVVELSQPEEEQPGGLRVHLLWLVDASVGEQGEEGGARVVAQAGQAVEHDRARLVNQKQTGRGEEKMLEKPIRFGR